MKKLLLILAFIPLIANSQYLVKYGDKFIVYNSQLVQATPFNESAKALFARMDVQPTNEEKTIYSIAFDSLEFYNLDDKFDMFFVPNAPSAQAATLDWFRDTALVVVDSMYFLNHLGYVRNNTNGYIDTRFNPTNGTNLSLDDAYYGVRLKNKYAYEGGVQIGVGSTGSLFMQTMVGNNNTWNNHVIHAGTVDTYSAPITGDFNGLFTIGRTNSTQYVLLNEGDKFTRTRASTGVPNADIYLNAFNFNGSPSSYTRNIVEAAYASSALTDFEHDKLDQILEDYSNSMFALRTEDIYENDDIELKLVNNDDVGYALRLLYQRGNNKIAVFGDTIWFSYDNGVTYPHKSFLDMADDYSFATMYSTGAMLIASSKERKLLVSYDSLGTLIERTLKDIDGSDYTYHTPVNANFPGQYFDVGEAVETVVDQGREILFWGNYGNISSANPTLIYYSPDTLQTIKVAYRFGVDSSYRDAGSAPSDIAGNYLGDPTNPVVARHVHSFDFSVLDTTYWLCTGDSWPNTTGQNEARWLRGKYDQTLDTWQWDTTLAMNEGANSRWKSTGINYYNDTIYFGSDGGPDYGIWKARADEITEIDSLVLAFDIGRIAVDLDVDESGNMLTYTSYNYKVYYSDDRGFNWRESTFQGLIPTSYTGVSTFYSLKKADNDGYYMLLDNSYPAETSATNPTGISFLFKFK